MKKNYLFILGMLLSLGVFSQCTVVVNSLSPSCHGSCDGFAKAVPSGSTPPYTYSWSTSPSQTTPLASGLCAGTYTVKVTTGSGCNVTKTVVLAQPAALVLNMMHTNPKCNGGNAGTASANVSGGTPPYAYNWSTTPVKTTKTIGNLGAGTYTVTVTDKRGCLNTATVTLTEPAALTPTVTATNTSCGGSTGTASVAVTGGTGQYTYSWATSPVRTTPSITGLPAGSFAVSVSDSNGCKISANAVVGNTGGLTASITQTNVSCNGGSNGSATITGSGGATPYTYSWSTFPSQSTATISGLTAGTYYVSISDKNGCAYTSTVNITAPPVLTATVTHVNVSCTGSASGTATANVTGGSPVYSYSWSTTPAQSTKTAINLSIGTYTVTVTDANGCSVTKTVTMNQPANALTATITHTNPKCNGGGGGTATAHPKGGTVAYTYSWSTTPAQTTAAITGLAAGNYILKVTDSKGCSVTDSVLVTQPLPIALVTTETSSACGLSTGTASVTVSGGAVHPFTYSWNTTPLQTTATATAIAAGVYKVTVTDSNGCKNNASVTVGNTGGATLTVSSTVNVSCRGGSTGSATIAATGGVGAYTYSWSTTPSQNTATATGLKAGTYTVKVTEANGCSSLISVTITQPVTAVKGTVTATDPNCNGGTGSAKVFPTGGTPGYTYSWKTIPSQTTQAATNLSAGTFTVYIKDANGCQSRDTIVLTQPAAITALITKTNVTCNGDNTGDAAVTVAGGTAPYTYSWSTTPAQTTRTITGLIAGTYTVAITDSKGCLKTKTVVITQPTPIVLTTTAINANCGHSDGSATVVATGGKPAYQYSWNTTPAQTTTTANGIPAGIYKITVTDSSGCIQKATIAVHNANAATASIASTKINCYGNTNGTATVSLTGGVTPFVYSWSTTPAQTGATATNLGAGVYSIKITDANGCVTNDTVALSQPTVLTASLIQNNVSCTGTADGYATATALGGTAPFSYSWSTTPAQNAATASGLIPGNYTVTLTDANGCMVTSACTISQKAIVASATVTDVKCHGGLTGSAVAHVSNGTSPYTYSWSSAPVQTNQVASNLAAGIYTLSVKDSSGCSDQTALTITEPAALTTTIALTNVNCQGGHTGIASTTAMGGTSPYTYSWSTIPVQTSPSATNLTAGNYTVNVTDTNGCLHTQTIALVQPMAITGTTSTLNAHCANADGAASVSVKGGSGPYTYSWNTSPPQTTDTATLLVAGVYLVTISDSLGCSDTVTAHINNATAATISSNQINATCSTSANGSAIVIVSGGTSPFRYSWSTNPVQTTPAATGLLPGSYTARVTDTLGCTSTIVVVITSPAALNGNMTQTNITCNGNKNGKATVSASGGTPQYTYSWSTVPAQTSASVTGLDTGTYMITITDSQGCKGLDSVMITQPDSLISSLTNLRTSCYGTTDGVSTVTVKGGTVPYGYSWSTNPAQTGSTATGLSAGSYTVMVTDSNGCSVTGMATISQPAAIHLATTSSPASCGNSDGSASVAVTAGGILPFTYSWSSGATAAVASNQSAGIYTISVTDSSGCSTIDTAYISNSGSASISLNTQPGCVGADNGTAQVVVTGGTAPFTFYWSTVPPQSTALVSGLAPGSYKVMVTDSFGCIVFGTAIIMTPVPFIIDSITSTPIHCTGCSNATASAFLQGGSLPYTYSWSTSPVQTTQTATNLSPGSYSVCITDASGCQLCDGVTISNVLGIQVYEAGNMKISYYPNPSSGDLTVSIQQASQVPFMYLRMMNLVGQEVFANQIELTGSITTRTFDLSAYPKGIYLIQMINGSEMITQKLILR